MFKLDRTDGRCQGILLPEKMVDQEILAKRLLRRTAVLQRELKGDMDRLKRVGISAESSQKSYAALLERNVLQMHLLERCPGQDLPVFWTCLSASIDTLFQAAFSRPLKGFSQSDWVCFHLRVGYASAETVRGTVSGSLLLQRKLIVGDVSLRQENIVAQLTYCPQDYGLAKIQGNQQIQTLSGNFPSLTALQLAWQSGIKQAFLLGMVESDILAFLAGTQGTEILRPQVR